MDGSHCGYTLTETDPEKAVDLLAWVHEYPNPLLNWVRQWPLFDRLPTHLQNMLESEKYQMHWEKGQDLTSDDMNTYLQREFCPLSDETAEEPQRLTARESEILGLMAEGMTNPQIAAQLVIGAGTVKTHTLNIYRKLDVANRTQAIVHAQQLGILHMASPTAYQ
jgi:ATP/maltotriose-dependent transcriptional regulator MalT